jgi:hypothetical protein
MTDTLPAIAELQAIDQWLSWCWEKVKGKDTKVPYVANNGSHASVIDPATWVAYPKANAAFKKLKRNGLGFVVTADDPYCGIDLDHCRDKVTGVIEPRAMEIVKALDSYTEVTPSGEGLRVWIKGRKTGTDCTKSMGDNGQKIEIYDQKRYFTVTGNHLPGTPDTINERQEELAVLEQEIWSPQTTAPQTVPTTSPTAQVTAGPSLSASAIIQLLKKSPKSVALMDGDMSEYNNDHSRADEALCCMVARYTHDPQVIDQVFRQSKLAERGKWNRADYRDRTISKAVATVPVGYRAVAIAPNLPAAFWNARLSLRTIRQAAYSRGRSADAVLGALLTRVAAGVPHLLRIPPIVGTAVPLCLFDIVVGPPGSGKSSAYGVAVELHPLDPPSVDDPSKIRVADRLPIGSGEGLVEVLFDTRSEKDDVTTKTKEVKYQALYNAAFYVDEGSVLSALGNRAGSVLLPTLRTIFTGGPLGQTNASKERRRIVPAGHYAIGVCVAFQAESAGAFLEDEAAGTPQRFLWFSAIDPSIPNDAPLWPGAALPLKLADFFGMRDRGPRDMVVADSIRSEVRAADGARNRGEVVAESLQAHADLIRLKVAALLAILDGRLEVNDEDWQLATQIKATSDGVLAHVQEQVRQAAVRKESQTSQRLARRQVVAVSAVDQHRTVECAERIHKKVKDRPGVTVSAVRRGLTPRLRDAFQDGLDHAVAQKWVIEKAEAGQGGDKRSLYPGPGRSSES